MDQSLESANQNSRSATTSPCVGLAPENHRAPKLRLIFKNGNRCTIPYAYFLRTEYNSEGSLSLFTVEKEVVIQGRGLDLLEDWLYDNHVVWIKESHVVFDGSAEPIYVSGIEVKERQ
ncbi:MAG: hypothetical protein AAF694_04175 [Bacteroidota bacterium]